MMIKGITGKSIAMSYSFFYLLLLTSTWMNLHQKG